MKPNKILLTFVVVLLLIICGTSSAQTDEEFTVGYFLWFSGGAFINEMTELGYVEGENITYLRPDATGFEAMTMEEIGAKMQSENQRIVDAQPDVIITNTDTDAVNMRALAPDIPIVFARSDDPVATGAVADLINPGGLTTGIITNRPHERRLQVLTEIKPDTDKVYYLYSTMTGEAETVLGQVQAVAEDLNVEVIPAPITDVPSALEIVANAPEDIDWLFLTPFVPFDMQFYADLNALSLERQIGITGVTDTPIPGYLMGYGPNIDDSDAQAARMVDRILRGAAPADLPVEIAENFLMINLEQAAAISMDIPENILRQANIIVRPGYFEEFPPFGSN